MKRHASHVAIILAAGLVARVLLFDQVGVWGDFGFWAYDSRMIMEGQTPFVDFPGRSPLMVYLLAVVRDLLGMDARVLRAVVIVLWVLAGVPTYLIARQLHSHRAGVVAAALLLLTPFSLVYGMWVNSQALMVLLSLSGLYTLLRSDRAAAFALSGSLFGLAYLSRRSVVVVPLTIGLYYVYEWARYSRSTDRFRELASRGSLMVLAFFGTLLVGYGAMVGYNPDLTLAIFRVDFVGLFYSNGRGTYPMVGVDVPAFQNSVGDPIPVVNALCQVCGAWTARVGLHMLLLGLPMFVLLWPYTRALTRRYYSTAETQYMYGALGALGVYAIYLAVTNGFMLRAIAVVIIGTMGVVAYHGDAVPPGELSSRDRRLVAVILAAVIVAYLYRNRRLHVYYMMDTWALWSILASLATVEAWQRYDPPARTVATVVVAAAIVTSGATAYPFMDVAVDDNEARWFTHDNLDEYRQDIDARTEPGDTVLTAHPSYVIASNASLPRNSSRLYYTAYLYNGTRLDRQLYSWLVPRLQNGTIPLVILGGLTMDLFRWNESAARAFTSSYCRVPSADRLYNRTGAALYRYQPSACDKRPTITDA